jgi:hypothetical protein
MAKKKLVEAFQLDELDFRLSMLLGNLKGSISRNDAVLQLEQIQNYLRESIMQKVKEEKNDIKKVVFALMKAYENDKELNETYYRIYQEIDKFEKKLLTNGVKKEEIDWVNFYFFYQQTVEDIEKKREEKK